MNEMREQSEQLSYSPDSPQSRQTQLHRLPLRERPAGRLVRIGEGALSLVELLALIVGGPQQLEIAVALLAQFDLPGLAQANLSELDAVPGLGEASAARVKAALELARRLALVAAGEKPQICNPTDAAVMMMAEMSHREQETFWVLFLNARNRVIGSQELYRGDLNQSPVRVGEVFREAVRRNCAAIIIGHNHPSGDPSPSPEDVSVTHELASAGKLLGVEVLDHLVIGQQRWVSLRERGLGFDASD